MAKRQQRNKAEIEDAVKQLREWDHGVAVETKAAAIANTAAISMKAARVAAQIVINEENYYRDIIVSTLQWVLGDLSELPYIVERVKLEEADDTVTSTSPDAGA